MKSINEQIIEAMEYRHACKVFDSSKKIKSNDFDTILEAGRLSPSSFGFEPWKFLVIQDKKLLEKLHPISWGAATQFTTASHIVVLLARKMNDMLAGSKYIFDVMENIQKLPKEIQEKKNDFYKAFQKNDFDLTDERKIFDWSCKQTYIALANMMMAASLLKIDSCPMEGFDRLKFEQILIDEGVMDEEHFGVSVMVAFGYRQNDIVVRDKTRGQTSNIVKWVK